MLVRKSICCKTFQGGSWGGGVTIYIYIYIAYNLSLGVSTAALTLNTPQPRRDDVPSDSPNAITLTNFPLSLNRNPL